MAKKFKIIKVLVSLLVVILILPLIIITANSIPNDDFIRESSKIVDNSNDVYNSSRFTKVDDLSTNTIKGVSLRLENDVTEEEKDVKNYDVLVTKQNNKELYYNSYLHIFKVHNVDTGYVWSTGFDKINASQAKAPVAKMISSLVVMEYYFYDVKNETYGTSVTAVEMTKATGTDEYKISPNTDIKVTTQDIKNGKKLTLDYKKVGIKFNVYVSLDETGALDIEIPDSEIEECLNDKKNYLATIKIAPGLGATIDNLTPGYLVVPDGSGSLIRYGEVSTTVRFIKHYYSPDFGVNPNQNSLEHDLSLPIYGFVNGINQDGCLAVIESGDISSDLYINLSGAVDSKINFQTVQFKLRNQYLLYGINQATEDERVGADLKLHYEFVSNDNANYVGLANTYQNYLLTEGIFSKQTDGSYKLRIDALMSESVKALIGSKNVTMTSIEELNKMIEELNANDINDLILVLLGWNKSGYSGTVPYDITYNNKVGSKKEFKELNKNNEVYYYNDYVAAGEKGNFSKRTDVARSLQRLRLIHQYESNLYDEGYWLYPESSKEIASENIKKYDKLEISNLALDSIGYLLYTTYYQGQVSHTNASAKNYQELLNEFVDNDFKVALHRPFAYLFAYMNVYLDMPLYSNQFNYYTDTVPFLAYVFRGVMDYYAPYTNFFANQEEQLIRSFDFGAYPSYILTSGESRELKYTDSFYLYTTVYTHWKDNIIQNYNKLKEGYLAMGNSTVTSRKVLEPGLVVITYSNGKIIHIDYRNLCYKVEGGQNQWIYL